MKLYFKNVGPLALGNGTRDPGFLLGTLTTKRSLAELLIDAPYILRWEDFVGVKFKPAEGVEPIEGLTALRNGLVSDSESAPPTEPEPAPAEPLPEVAPVIAEP